MIRQVLMTCTERELVEVARVAAARELQRIMTRIARDGDTPRLAGARPRISDAASVPASGRHLGGVQVHLGDLQRRESACLKVGSCGDNSRQTIPGREAENGAGASALIPVCHPHAAPAAAASPPRRADGGTLSARPRSLRGFEPALAGRGAVGGHRARRAPLEGEEGGA